MLSQDNYTAMTELTSGCRLWEIMQTSLRCGEIKERATYLNNSESKDNNFIYHDKVFEAQVSSPSDKGMNILT